MKNAKKERQPNMTNSELLNTLVTKMVEQKGYPYTTGYLQSFLMQVIGNNLKFLIGDSFKLESIPVLNILSINGAEERRDNQQKEFDKYGLNKSKYYIYNKYEENQYNLLGKSHEKLLPVHIGITISHLQTIKQWLDSTTEEIGFFCEDDMSLETVQYWNFTWKEFCDNLPPDWEAVQLCLLSEVQREIKFCIRNSLSFFIFCFNNIWNNFNNILSN